MGMSINTNPGAEFSALAAARAAEMMDTAMLRLSSGRRINSAKDDAAGIQVAVRMDAEINGLGASLRNANDAQAAVDTAEGALAEIHTLLLRMREISVSAANDTNTQADRASLQIEVGALETEISRIGNNTTWGGINLLDGSFSQGNPLIFQLGPNNGNDIKVTIGYVNASVDAAAQGTLGLTGNGSVTTQTAAGDYISTIDAAISIISTRRGALGAVSNRLDSSLANLENMRANLITARGAVVDADFAEETARLARAQILLQAATAMLSQANASKQQMLALINS